LITSARLKTALYLLVCVALIATASACGGTPTSPMTTGHVTITATLAGGALASPEEIISSLRIDVRDASGLTVGNPVIVPVPSAVATFTAEADLPAGTTHEITVLAIGTRPVADSFDGSDAGTGVLYRGALAGVNVIVGATTARTVTLDSFVPKLEPLEILGSDVRVRWTALSGAERYSLTRYYDGVGFTTTPLTETSFLDDTSASRYQVVAIEKSGRRSAPSDFLVAPSSAPNLILSRNP
jgi:hypothetical protein